MIGSLPTDSMSFDGAADPIFAARLALRAFDLGDSEAAERLIAQWATSTVRVTDNPASRVRYRWLISTVLPSSWPPYIPPRSSWLAWRPAEEEVRRRDVGRFEARLLEPIVLADAIELLSRVEARQGPAADQAREILTEAMPAVRRDVAAFLAETHAWTDTWALWNLARRPAALRRLHPFALALADSYAERAIRADSVGTGSRYPFHDQAMVSVSAQLATGLLALGVHPRLTGRLVAFVRSAEDSEGGWADAGEPVDPLTTLVAADLLIGLDPSWDPSTTIGALDRLRGRDGAWTAYGPEVAWLTVEIERLIERAGEPFERRFRWPELGTQQRDRRTQLPFLGYLIDLERLYVEVDSLRDAPVELAFIDLAGFGDWNSRFGMAAGDEVLRFFAKELKQIPDSVAIRDGGDEFVVIGGPRGTGLPDRMTQFRTQAADHFREEFGAEVAPVAPRIVTLTTTGIGLVAGRDQLGRDIARLKKRVADVDVTGVQMDSRELSG